MSNFCNIFLSPTSLISNLSYTPQPHNYDAVAFAVEDFTSAILVQVQQ
jgi:hypothetical protein